MGEDGIKWLAFNRTRYYNCLTFFRKYFMNNARGKLTLFKSDEF